MATSGAPQRGGFRRAVWILPVLLTLAILVALLILADGSSLSALFYKSF